MYIIINISNSNSTHNAIRNNLLEAYIVKREEYPTNRSNAISLLNKYDEKKMVKHVPSKRTAFTQKGKKEDADKKGGREDDIVKDNSDKKFTKYGT